MLILQEWILLKVTKCVCINLALSPSFYYFSSVGHLDLSDDFNSTPQDFVFEPSTQNEEIRFRAPIFDDDTHEADEGFVARMLVSFVEDVDNVNFQNMRDLALIRITDDDGE